MSREQPEAKQLAKQPTEQAAEQLTEQPEAEAQPITIRIVPQDERAAFDELLSNLSGVLTPMPMTSEVFLAEQGINVVCAAYLQVRHVVTPYVLAEDAPADALDRVTAAMTDQLRATVRETLLAKHASAEELSANRGLAYDIYVPHGQAGPEGFERLPVEVWRRRVC